MKLPTGKFGDVLLVDGGWSPISLAIKRRTLSDWSHVARFVDNEWLQRAVDRRSEIARHIVGSVREGCMVVEALPSGVKIRDTSVYERVAWRVRTYAQPLGPIERAALGDWLIDQIGISYDWRGVLLGHAFRSDKLNSKGWFCSELQAAGDVVADRIVIADTSAALVPPHLYAATSGLVTNDWHIRKPHGWPEEILP
jgi:hypothetical protein